MNPVETTSMDPGAATYDALVIGAGLSGLVAARRLHMGGASVRVVEARERVGGRILSAPLGASVVDLGGQWLSPSQERLAALAHELDISTHPQYRSGRTVLAWGARRETSWWARVPGMHLLELSHRIRQIERMSRAVSGIGPAAEPAAADRAAAWQARSLGDWISSTVVSERARSALRLLVGLHLGVEPEEVSLLYFLHFLAVTSGLTGAGLRAQGPELRFVGGAQQLCVRLAEALDGHIRLGFPVSAVAHDRTGVAATCGEYRLRSRFAVLAVPPPVSAALAVSPPWPEMRRRLLERYAMAPVIKCALAYATPFWRTAGLSGEGYRGAGLVRAVIDHSDPDGRQPVLMAFITGDDARQVSGLAPDERRTLVVDELVELFGEQARAVTGYIDKDWPADPLNAGCVGFVGPGPGMADSSDDGFDDWSALRVPVGRIHFAGTETAVRWPHYLDGAVEAGERAAREVLARLSMESGDVGEGEGGIERPRDRDR